MNLSNREKNGASITIDLSMTSRSKRMNEVIL